MLLGIQRVPLEHIGWYAYILNPTDLLTPWHGSILSLLLLFGLSYWLYDMTINWIDGRGNKWYYHSSTKDPKFWKGEFYAWILITIIWAVFGGMLEAAC